MQCLNQIVLGLFHNTHSFESRVPREKKKYIKEEERKEALRLSSLLLSNTLDDRDSEALWFQAQRASISSLVRSVLYPDPSRSNSNSSSGNYDKVAVSASRVPNWTPLMAMTLTPLSVSSGDEDGDSAASRGGISSDPPQASSHERGRLDLEGIPVRLTSPLVARQPPLDKQPDGLGHPPIQG
jgi:hypothetical protein